MIDNNRHIILKQSFLVQSPGKDGAFELQQTISKLYWDRIVPQLEQLFDEIVPAEELVRIEKLEIDLGNIPQKKLQALLESKLLEAIRQELDLYLNKKVEKVSRTPLKLSRFRQWLHFLEKGYLPLMSSQGLTEVELKESALASLAGERQVVEQLKELIQANPKALKRLIQQYEDAFLQQLLVAISGAKQDQILVFWEVLAQYLPLYLAKAKKSPKLSPSIFQNQQSLRLLFWYRLILNLFNQTGKLDGRRNAHLLLGVLLEEPLLFLNYVEEHLQKRPIEGATSLIKALKQDLEQPGNKEQTITKAWREQLLAEKKGIADRENTLEQEDGIKKTSPQTEKEKRQFSNEKISNTPVESSASSDPPLLKTPDQNDPDLSREALEKEGSKKKQQQISKDHLQSFGIQPEQNQSFIEKLFGEGKTQQAIATGTPFYVQQAGMVLLHPFLSPYFKELALIREGAFVDIAAQHKAIHLVQYLATGQLELPEYQLLLPKLLCGLPFEESIERSVDISSKELEEADALIQAVIKHWSALGKASAQGLREGFIDRDGKLEKKEKGWLLQVERKTVDILVDRLPWGLSMIKLPWMPEMLRVDWV